VYADRLARRGYDLILVARNRDRLISLADRITNETHQSGEIVDADLNDRTALVGVEAILKQGASITLLLNNPGVGMHTPLLDSEVDAMTRMINLNVTALICRATSLHLAMRRDDRHRMSTLVRRCTNVQKHVSSQGKRLSLLKGAAGTTLPRVLFALQRGETPHRASMLLHRAAARLWMLREAAACTGPSLQAGSLKAVMTARHRNTDNRAGA
jgi:NAD(P)-dependent dehydrogenase (short-subunit alcohol dehydrogenase family)